jgi:hypothetical protein
MRRFPLAGCLSLWGAVAPLSHAQDFPEPVAQQESEIHADTFSLPSVTQAARREDSVNYRIVGKVRSITDGDSIVLTGKSNVRLVIRLSDLDTPETSHFSRRSRCSKGTNGLVVYLIRSFLTQRRASNRPLLI